VQHSYFYGETGRDFDLARLAFQQSGQKDALLAWERSLTPEVRQRQAVRDLLGNLAWDLADRDRYIERAASPGDVQVDAPLRELYLAIALLDRGETQRAQQRVEQVEQKLRQEVAEQPENAPSHARLGLALALRGGQRELALKHAKQAVRLVPQEADGYSAPQLRAAYACTLTWLGEREAAVKELELLTRRPYPENHSFFFPVHVEHLKVGLEWKPLHGLPAFEALLRAPETRAPL
jgi:tetratricopeptide (TPR) repeat protein